jgi:hypothetical protein
MMRLAPRLAAGWAVLAAAAVLFKLGLPWTAAAKAWLAAPWHLPLPAAVFAHAKTLAVVAALSWSLFSVGAAALRRLELSFETLLEEAVVAFGLGYGLAATALLLAGLAGLWSPQELGVLLLPVFILGGLEARRRFSLRGLRLPARAEAAWLAALLFVWLLQLRCALVPETFFDALVYHLALPEKYLVAGKILAVPENSYAGVPSLPQMPYGVLLAFDPWGVAAGAFHCSFALWTAAACGALSRRLGGGAAFAAAFSFCAPVMLTESFRVSVHLEWAVLELGLLLCLLAAAERPVEDSSRRKLLLAAGTLLGFSTACKYTAWPLPLSVLALCLLRKDGKPFLAWKEAALCCAAAVPWLAPWLLKNAAFYGNVLYPFFAAARPSGSPFTPDWTAFERAGALNSPAAALGGLARLPARLLAPADGTGQSLGLLPLCFMPAALFLRPSPARAAVLAFCGSAFVALGLFTDQGRYFIPHYAVLSAVLAAGLWSVEPAGARRALLSAAAALMALTAAGWLLISPFGAKLAVFAGTLKFSDYLGHAQASYGAPPYAGYEFLNRLSPPPRRVLVHGDSRGFYLRAPYLAASVDQRSPLEALADLADDAVHLRRMLEEEGVDYILLNLGEMARQRLDVRASPKGRENLAAFWAGYTRRVFGARIPGDRWVGVYEVLSQEEAAKPHGFDRIFGAPAAKK